MAKKEEVKKGKGKEKEEVKKGKGKVKEEKPVEKAAKGKEKAETKGKGKEAPAKGKGKEKEVKRGRGRVAGVRSEVSKKDADNIQKQFSTFEKSFEELADNIEKFLGGNKSAVGKARKNIQSICKMGKDFRKTLQDAKTGMKQVSI